VNTNDPSSNNSAAEPSAESTQGPLSGIKVLELGQLVAGPFAARMLGEFGATVIKIEPPGAGDPLRSWRKVHDGTSLWWYVQSRNKQSVAVDLRQPEGQAIVRRLAREADILIENFRPGTMERWDLGYAQLATDNPGLIMVRLSGFGQTGPMSGMAGFGAVGESMGGMRYVNGSASQSPARLNLSIGDSLTALHGVIGALMALHERKTGDGRGQVVDVAIYESVFNMMESLIPEYSFDGTIRERMGAQLAGIVPSNTYQSRDGVHIVIAANGDSIFKRLMQIMERDDLADDPQLARNAGRVERQQELDATISAWCAAHAAQELIALLQQAEVPHGKIFSAADIYADPQYRARDMILERQLPDGRSMAVPGIVPKLSRTPGRVGSLGPELGAHTAAVLQRHGYSSEDIATLLAKGVVQGAGAGPGPGQKL
jgi:formyl-CoA transferase